MQIDFVLALRIDIKNKKIKTLLITNNIQRSDKKTYS